MARSPHQKKDIVEASPDFVGLTDVAQVLGLTHNA